MPQELEACRQRGEACPQCSGGRPDGAEHAEHASPIDLVEEVRIAVNKAGRRQRPHRQEKKSFWASGASPPPLSQRHKDHGCCLHQMCLYYLGKRCVKIDTFRLLIVDNAFGSCPSGVSHSDWLMGRLTKTRLKPPFLLPMGALALQRGCQEAALQGGLCWAQQGFPRWRGPCNLLAQKESALCNQWGAKVIIREPSKEGALEPALPCILPPPPTMIAPGRPGCAP